MGLRSEMGGCSVANWPIFGRKTQKMESKKVCGRRNLQAELQQNCCRGEKKGPNFHIQMVELKYVSLTNLYKW